VGATGLAQSACLYKDALIDVHVVSGVVMLNSGVRTGGAIFTLVGAAMVLAAPATGQQNCEAIRAQMESYAQKAHLATAGDVAYLRSLEDKYNRCVASRGRSGGSSSRSGASSSGSTAGRSSGGDVGAATAGGAAVGALIGGAAARGGSIGSSVIGIGMGAIVGGIIGEALASGAAAADEDTARKPRRRKKNLDD
jgi:uncharacterized membrane protein